ncbi:MAG: hypothetical protein OHK0039_37990 [Bacteroidia bacterium]
MCEHLTALDDELKAKGIRETFWGQPWSANCREWVYYDCVLALEALRQRHRLPDFVKVHINDDDKSGLEAGFYCEVCKDAVMGQHPRVGGGGGRVGGGQMRRSKHVACLHIPQFV